MTDAQRKRSQALAREFKKFRVDNLFTQAMLADQLRCSRRTIVSIENAELISPHYHLLRKFRDLKAREERRVA
jgi:DNA-binding XRE family transcriptional regulator